MNKYQEALDKAIDVLMDITDCRNISGDRYYHCPFKEECEKGVFIDCVATKEKWKEWLNG